MRHVGSMIGLWAYCGNFKLGEELIDLSSRPELSDITCDDCKTALLENRRMK